MDNQTVLILVLIALVVTLTVLLVRRIRHEREQLAAIKRMNLTQFGEFLRANSTSGNIAEVAGKVSDLLINVFECPRIIFLRKKRQNLELNYFHGLSKFDRQDFRIRATHHLIKKVSADFLPRSIETLRDELPTDYFQRLGDLGIGLYFPIFWRENLYGVYFLRSTAGTRSLSFNMMVASLAQSLSAAYHIKWHESRYELTRTQLEKARRKTSQPQEERLHSNLLKLIGHRNSQTLIPSLIESIRKDLAINRIAYLYEPKGQDVPSLVQDGIDRSVMVPDKRMLKELFDAVKSDDVYSLADIQKRQPKLRDWAGRLRSSGLDHITAFNISGDRPGILAWSGGSAVPVGRKQLDAIKAHARDLIRNVEHYEEVEEMSQTDGLTGLANQRYFRRRLDEEIQRARRYERQLALIMFDLDSLKQTNDTYGHLAGDEIIRQMGIILRNNIRSIDIVARYGGDEFCIIMPEADEETCVKFMNRLNQQVSRSKFDVPGLKKKLSTTISLGGAVFPNHAGNPRQLIFAADMALLQAKEQGRDKSVLYDEALSSGV